MINGFAPLQQSELFATLTEDELSRLAPMCSDFVAIEDALLFTEGRRALHLYLVTEGQVALQKAIPCAPRHRRTSHDHNGLQDWRCIGVVRPSRAIRIHAVRHRVGVE